MTYLYRSYRQFLLHIAFPTRDDCLTLLQGFDDLTGCALAIAYKSDVRAIQPEDFTVFSINQTCVWTRFTDFQVPANMPPCPPEGCHCAWFWIHSSNSGSQQSAFCFLQMVSAIHRSSSVGCRLYERIQVQRHRIYLDRSLGPAKGPPSMWCRPTQRCYEPHARKLHVWCQEPLLLVPEGKKQRTSP